MAAVRTVLIDKFSAYGNPFVSLATSITSIFSGGLQVEERPKTDLTGPVAAEAPPQVPSKGHFNFQRSETFRRSQQMHTSLRRLFSGKCDYGLEDGRFVVKLLLTQHALDFLHEIDIQEVDLERLPTVESDIQGNSEEDVSTECAALHQR